MVLIHFKGYDCTGQVVAEETTATPLEDLHASIETGVKHLQTYETVVRVTVDIALPTV